MAKLIAKNINSKWPKPIKYMGGGANGRVYHTNDGRLMKFVYSRAPQEFRALEKLQGSFIVPRFKKGDGHVISLRNEESREIGNSMFPNLNFKKYLTVFVMGRAGNSSTSMTLWQYLQKFPGFFNKANVQRRVQYLIEQLHLRGVSHGDLHANNIIVRVTPTGQISGMWAIDFGRSKILNAGKTERETAAAAARPFTMYKTFSVMAPVKRKNVPVRNGARSNVHMMNAMYGSRLSPAWERRIANIRHQVSEEMKQYKSPARGAKSQSLRKNGAANSRRGRSAPRSMP